jgi:leucyl/phenylalanyl-tRNA--protein transferase
MPVYLLSDDLIFPSPPLASEEGLLAVGGDLSQERLLLAYRMGIFPWYSEDEPIMWWSPDPRLVLYPAELNVSKSLEKTMCA